MAQGNHLAVLQADDIDQFRSELIRSTRQLGFETVSATTVVDRPAGDTVFLNVDNTPVGYWDMFIDRSSSRFDPVAQHCKSKSFPICWDQQTYLNAGQINKWEHQARFGYRYGIALAIHMPRGLHFMLGIDRDQPLPVCPSERSRVAADLLLLAVHTEDAARRLLLPTAPQQADSPCLTRRELECLRWTMEGKTAWELGRILGIAEQTAARHINNASQKLACVNKHQAVLKALRLNLIW